MTLDTVVFAVLAFVCGSLPFSVWIGTYGLKADIRQYGDGNPGAFNVMRAGGLTWGALAIFLDVFKAAFPVGLAAHVRGIEGLSLVLIAIAPPFGHAFSPFLRFRGGKAVASVGGVWIGLTIAEVSLVMLIMLIFWYSLLTSSAWSVMFMMVSILIYMLATSAPEVWLITWLILLLLLIHKHWTELFQLPGLRKLWALYHIWNWLNVKDFTE